MSITAVLFDLDGTLLDTLEDLYLTVNEAFRNNGYPERTKEEVRLATGHGAAYLLKTLLPDYVSDEEAERILNEYKPLLKKNQNNHTRPYDRILELMSELKERGIKTAINSNKPDEVARGLAEIYFKDSADACIGDREGVARKPEAEGALLLLNEMGKTAKDALYVGDSEIDIATAKNLGAPAVGVTWGFRDRDVLEAAGADFIIDKPAQLLEVIDKLNSADI